LRKHISLARKNRRASPALPNARTLPQPFGPGSRAQPIAVRRSKEYAGRAFGLQRGSHTSPLGNLPLQRQILPIYWAQKAGNREMVRCGKAI